MAVEGVLTTIPGLEAGEDLSNDQYKFVKLTDDFEVKKAGAGEMAIGVLQNAPDNGEAATVAVFGKTKVKADGDTDTAISAGDAISSNSGGVAVKTGDATTDDSDRELGQALNGTSADGEVISAFINCVSGYDVSTT